MSCDCRQISALVVYMKEHNFDLGQGKDFVYHGKTEFRGIHEDDVLGLSGFQRQKFGVDEVYQLYPEYYILKVNDFNRWSRVPLEQWIYFLATSEIPADADAPGLQEARQKLLFSHMSREEQNAYRRYIDDRVILADQIYTARGEGKLEGRFEGRIEGLAEGRAEEKLENARNLKKNGIPADIIAKSLGLTTEEVEALS